MTTTTAARIATENTFQTHDGVPLFYRHWAASGLRRGAVVLFHRGHEHAGRMAHLVDELNLPDFDFFAWDARGHGRSPGQRGFSPSFGTSVRDVQTFMDHIAANHGVQTQDIYVVAQSVGAVLIATWVHDYAPRIRGMSLASPAFKVKLYVPFARAGIKLMTKLRGNFFVNSYVKAKFLTHDEGRIASYDTDPLITRPISANILLGLYEAAERVVADAAAITVPTQLLISGADWVVHDKPQRLFFDRLSSRIKVLHELQGFYHDTLGERDRAEAVNKIRAFISDRFASVQQPIDLRLAHRVGRTFDEAKKLAEALPWWSPRAWYWGMARSSLRMSAPLSKGLQLGHATGFDSGSTLDYVYLNQATGLGMIGRAIDRTYLNSIGWRGIRQRKLHVEELLQLAMEKVRAQGLPLNLMDIAAGHGRYVLDAVAQSKHKPDSVLLRDYSDINVRDGTALIASRGLNAKARFVQADAFDRSGLATTSPVPTVVVVSGLYELFADNDLIERSLSGLAEAMPNAAYLVYTGQPWHPQLELIARTLTSHREGQAWVMRRRTQCELDQLVRAAGFEKVTQRIDEWGIFTVSMAVRVKA